MLEGQGVDHQRLFLYRPGTALVIVDHVRSDVAHTYTRYLQLHPAIELGDRDESSIQISAPGFGGAIYDAGGESPATRTQARGQTAPLQGLTSPDFREFDPRWTLAFADSGATETRALTIALDSSGLRATDATTAGTTTTVRAHRRRGRDFGPQRCPRPPPPDGRGRLALAGAGRAEPSRQPPVPVAEQRANDRSR